MSRISYLLLMALTIIICCFLQWKTCCSACNKGCAIEKPTQNVVAPALPEATKLPFAINDAEGNLSLNTNDNFNFKTSAFNYETPLSVNVDENIVKLKEYVTTNKGKSLNITGFYTANEENTSIYPNLGVARANDVKNYLVSKGISSKIINTFGELKEDLYPDANGIFYGPLKFEMTTALESEPAEDYSQLLAEIKANPLVLHFETGKNSVNLTPEQREMFAKISRYLDKVDNTNCLIVGHTDNTGNAQENMNLGQKRANFAKGYLERNGISASKIEAVSKGQTQPIATNNTEEGKAQNRRTVITIK